MIRMHTFTKDNQTVKIYMAPVLSTQDVYDALDTHVASDHENGFAVYAVDFNDGIYSSLSKSSIKKFEDMLGLIAQPDPKVPYTPITDDTKTSFKDHLKVVASFGLLKATLATVEKMDETQRKEFRNKMIAGLDSNKMSDTSYYPFTKSRADKITKAIMSTDKNVAMIFSASYFFTVRDILQSNGYVETDVINF